mmetsp:Transcript_13407/g.38097  ORF Transcript_13407/g.38097 Transcript_13407/m.38097 type:complete len:117 (-) Transcript_13407:465-815(-)
MCAAPELGGRERVRLWCEYARGHSCSGPRWRLGRSTAGLPQRGPGRARCYAPPRLRRVAAAVEEELWLDEAADGAAAPPSGTGRLHASPLAAQKGHFGLNSRGPLYCTKNLQWGRW